MARTDETDEGELFSARTAIVENLRDHIDASIAGQRQLLSISIAAVAAIASFGWDALSRQPEALAFLGVVFLGFSLAILRLDQEISIVANHLENERQMGTHALVQKQWEAAKFTAMQQSGSITFLASASQTAGLYGIPVLASTAFFAVALREYPSGWTVFFLIVGVVFFVLFVAGVVDVVCRYRKLGGR